MDAFDEFYEGTIGLEDDADDVGEESEQTHSDRGWIISDAEHAAARDLGMDVHGIDSEGRSAWHRALQDELGEDAVGYFLTSRYDDDT